MRTWKAGSIRGVEHLYDEQGYEYPIDEYGQIYVPLEPEQTVAGETEEEMKKETKN